MRALYRFAFWVVFPCQRARYQRVHDRSMERAVVVQIELTTPIVAMSGSPPSLPTYFVFRRFRAFSVSRGRNKFHLLIMKATWADREHLGVLGDSLYRLGAAGYDGKVLWFRLNW